MQHGISHGMHQACQDWPIDKADVTQKHNSVAQGLEQLHGLNIRHKNVEPRGCLLKHMDKCLKLADLANSIQPNMCMYVTPYLVCYLDQTCLCP